jgi:hypothetical protein
MAGVTNRGKKILLELALNDTALGAAVATFYACLVTADDAPDADTNVLADLTEVGPGNGYTAGGLAIPRSAWTMVEDDTGNLAYAMRDFYWTADGGFLPAAGYARYVVLCTDSAAHDVVCYCDLADPDGVGGRRVLDSEQFYIVDFKIQGAES